MDNDALLDTIYYEASQRTAFSTGRLRDAWAEAYPMLFDHQDLAIAANQPQYHFVEWLGAVHLYHAMGYLSLIEQYEFISHRRKRAILEAYVPDATRRLLFDRTAAGRAQAPDLFVYSERPDAWFFCEVKGPGDRVTEAQERWFKELADASGKPIRLLRVAIRQAPANTPLKPTGAAGG